MSNTPLEQNGLDLSEILTKVNALPSGGGITPSGSITLTEERSYDVTDKATAVVDFSTTRANLAEAVTAKGVDTLPTSSFDTIATNIGLISGGGGNVYHESGEVYFLDDYSNKFKIPITGTSFNNYVAVIKPVGYYSKSGGEWSRVNNLDFSGTTFTNSNLLFTGSCLISCPQVNINWTSADGTGAKASTMNTGVATRFYINGTNNVSEMLTATPTIDIVNGVLEFTTIRPMCDYRGVAIIYHYEIFGY